MRWIVALIVLGAAFVGCRIYLLRRMGRDLIKVHRLGQRTPAARGLLFEELPIDSGVGAAPFVSFPASGAPPAPFPREGAADSASVGALSAAPHPAVAPPSLA